MSSAARVPSIILRLSYRRRPPCEYIFTVRHAFGGPTRSSPASGFAQHHNFMPLSTSTGDGKAMSNAKTVEKETTNVDRAGAGKDGGENSSKLIYEGSLAHEVRSLKRISITTCIISILAVPALAVWGTKSVPMAGQVAVMGTALAGAGGSTLLLNLCVSPYVLRLAEVIIDANGGESDTTSPPNIQHRSGKPRLMGRRFVAERMNLFGFPTTSEFYIDQVEPMPKTSRPFVSFRADGEYYFVQGNQMADKDLLRTLLGRELKQHEKQ